MQSEFEKANLPIIKFFLNVSVHGYQGDNNDSEELEMKHKMWIVKKTEEEKSM